VASLVGGEDWERAIRHAIRRSSHFVAILSRNSVSKRGFVQKELREALDVVDEYPPDRHFIVPVRLDECTPIHEKLTRLHWIDVFPRYSTGLDRLAVSLGLRTKRLTANSQANREVSRARRSLVKYPRVFISCSTAHDRTRLQELLTALLDNRFQPVLGTGVVGENFVRHGLVFSDIAAAVFKTIPTGVAFISLQTKRDDYHVGGDYNRYVLPSWLVAEEVYAWSRQVPLLIRVRDVAVEEAAYNRHVLTCAFSSDQDYQQAVQAALNALNEFRMSAAYQHAIQVVEPDS